MFHLRKRWTNLLLTKIEAVIAMSTALAGHNREEENVVGQKK